MVAHKLPQFTRSSLSNLFTMQLVFVGGKPVKASYKIRKEDKLEVDVSLLTAHPANIELPIIYEDDDVIVINKPAGILTHSKGALNTEATVASFIKSKLNDKALKGNRAGIVHRLDRMTSGVIITAKNGPALKYLQKQFSTRKVKKIYQAIVEGRLKFEEAVIDAPIERNPGKPQSFRVSNNGRAAITKYKVLKLLNPPDKLKAGKSYSLVELTPKTGRTHQLRVHLKYIGHPIVGDRVYGRDGDHLYLYAKLLELRLPSGRLEKFEAPQPKVFKNFLRS